MNELRAIISQMDVADGKVSIKGLADGLRAVEVELTALRVICAALTSKTLITGPELEGAITGFNGGNPNASPMREEVRRKVIEIAHHLDQAIDIDR